MALAAGLCEEAPLCGGGKQRAWLFNHGEKQEGAIISTTATNGERAAPPTSSGGRGEIFSFFHPRT